MVAWAGADLVWLFCGQDEVKVLGRIGEGAFGEVSLATCAIFGKVAVKWLKARAAMRNMRLRWSLSACIEFLA